MTKHALICGSMIVLVLIMLSCSVFAGSGQACSNGQNISNCTTDQNCSDGNRASLGTVVVNLDVPYVPYIHQCWDTAGWFDGRAACGATCAVMILAKYGAIAPHPIICDLPSPHTSDYGWYVSEQYTSVTGEIFGDVDNERTYDYSNNYLAKGAYGYIHHPDHYANPDLMVSFFQKNGLQASKVQNPTESYVKNQIDNGHPVVASTYLTGSGGHIVVIKGYTSDNPTLYIVNDPYGSYPYSGTICGNIYGENVKYTWAQMQVGVKYIVTASPTCTNECTSGATQCSGSGYQTCGNYDSDSCTEWSSVTNCPTGQSCSNGQCNPVSGWNTLGGYVTSSPSVVVDNLGKTEAWVRGGDNALWVNIDGTWRGKGGVLSSDPFAVKDYNGKIHVLVRGGDNGVWDFIYDPIAATGHWKGLGKYINEKPTAAQDPMNLGVIRVAVKGGDNTLWTCDLNINTETYAWTSLGGGLASRPYIMFDDSKTEHIFVRGGDNQLWDSKGSWTGSTWSRMWNPLGGILANGPIATIEPGSSSYAAVFAKGSDNALWMCDVYSGSNPETSAWYGFGGVISSDPFAVADTSANKIHVFARGGYSALWENIFTTSPWSPSGNQWQGIGGSILTYTPGASIGSNTQAFVIGTDNALWRNTHTTFSAASSGGDSSQKQKEPNQVNYPAGDPNSAGGKS